MNIYFFIAQKRVYGRSWVNTMVKFVIIFVSNWGVLLFYGLSILVILGSFFG